MIDKGWYTAQPFMAVNIHSSHQYMGQISDPAILRHAFNRAVQMISE
jgi:hypothetical protein